MNSFLRFSTLAKHVSAWALALPLCIVPAAATAQLVTSDVQNTIGPMGGFQGPIDAQVTTAARAKLAWDDTHVALRGNIVRSLGGERYEFRDASGTIVVEIDHDKWYGLQITPKDTVTLYGEVDRDFHRVEIDVKRIVKAA